MWRRCLLAIWRDGVTAQNSCAVRKGTRYHRQTFQSFDLALDLNYIVFDFGRPAGRIDAAKAELLAADFAFNDVHRLLIYRVETAYYQLLNAIGQEAAARATLATLRPCSRPPTPL
jgi:outer membrane protein